MICMGPSDQGGPVYIPVTGQYPMHVPCLKNKLYGKNKEICEMTIQIMRKLFSNPVTCMVKIKNWLR